MDSVGINSHRLWAILGPSGPLASLAVQNANAFCRTLEGLQTLASFQDWCIDSDRPGPRPAGRLRRSKIAPGDFVIRLCHLSGGLGSATAHFGARGDLIQQENIAADSVGMDFVACGLCSGRLDFATAHCIPANWLYFEVWISGEPSVEAIVSMRYLTTRSCAESK